MASFRSRTSKKSEPTEASKKVLEKIEAKRDFEVEKFGVNTSSFAEKQSEIDEKDKSTLIDLVTELIDSRAVTSKKEWSELVISLRKKYHISPSKAQMRAIYDALVNSESGSESECKCKRNVHLENYLTRKQVRALSGVLVITLFTAPYPEYTAPDDGSDDDDGDNDEANESEKVKIDFLITVRFIF